MKSLSINLGFNTRAFILELIFFGISGLDRNDLSSRGFHLIVDHSR